MPQFCTEYEIENQHNCSCYLPRNKEWTWFALTWCRLSERGESNPWFQCGFICLTGNSSAEWNESVWRYHGVESVLTQHFCACVCLRAQERERIGERNRRKSIGSAVNPDWSTKSMCECENSFGDGAEVFLPRLEEKGSKEKKKNDERWSLKDEPRWKSSVCVCEHVCTYARKGVFYGSGQNTRNTWQCVAIQI